MVPSTQSSSFAENEETSRAPIALISHVAVTTGGRGEGGFYCLYSRIHLTTGTHTLAPASSQYF